MMKRVLVVENDGPTCGIIVAALDQGIYEVRSCADAEEGIKEAFDWMPDLVILDLMLGPVGGETVYHRLKEDKKTAEIPIVVCTVIRAVGIQRRMGLLPAHILFKPFPLNALLSIVEQALVPDTPAPHHLVS